MVDGATDGAVAMAVGNLAEGAEHTIVLTAGGGDNAIIVDGGKTIAIVSSDTTGRVVEGAAGSPTVTVTGEGSTVYLHRLALIANTTDVGVSVEASGTLYADSTRIAQNPGSGGITLAAGTSGFLRNCMVAGFAGNASAISSSGTLSIVYSTLGRDTNFGDPVLECSGGLTTVRNSIIVSQTDAPGTEVDCPGISLINGAERATQTPADWFGAGFASGDYFLNAVGAFGNHLTVINPEQLSGGRCEPGLVIGQETQHRASGAVSAGVVLRGGWAPGSRRSTGREMVAAGRGLRRLRRGSLAKDG